MINNLNVSSLFYSKKRVTAKTAAQKKNELHQLGIPIPYALFAHFNERKQFTQKIF